MEQGPNNPPTRIERDTHGISAVTLAKTPEGRDCHTRVSKTGNSSDILPGKPTTTADHATNQGIPNQGTLSQMPRNARHRIADLAKK